MPAIYELVTALITEIAELHEALRKAEQLCAKQGELPRQYSESRARATEQVAQIHSILVRAQDQQAFGD